MYELCCDMIDLLINMSQIYGKPNGNVVQANEDEVDDDAIVNGESSEDNLESEDDGNSETVSSGIDTRGKSYSSSEIKTQFFMRIPSQ